MEKRRGCRGLEGTPSRLAVVSCPVDMYADGMVRFDMDYMLFDGLVPAGQQRQDSVVIDAELEEFLVGGSEGPARAERLSVPADSDSRSDENEGGEEEKESEDGGSTSAELAAEENSFLSRVSTGEGSRAALR